MTLSDEVAYRAGIDPLGDVPDLEDEPRVLITIPHPAELRELQEAVTFDERTVLELLTEAGAAPEALAAYTHILGEVSLDEGDMEGLPLDTKPLVQAGGTFVVAVATVTVAVAG